MAQISLYITNSLADKLATAAKTNNCSVSKYVADIVSENLTKYETDEINKKQTLKKLCGALDDPTFITPSELSWENEFPRKFDLL